ncbi:uncharacterized protein BDR25DRAFT_304454 [Lindgomyces ingoldianus]|uniref:Uncharacterized protein n=1 Tax=Lindgomyces ingoldianus TaxID=673940 RepID=A0ACB6QSP1_9PLEO|nr:uncharacterized protein BDR25DRAFT_304454 [Lindgomyces ingoldianus]KAF2469317.1 hypothetical protein BDR25DRAFT_304454 [Lindgomyces ingoldianus]
MFLKAVLRTAALIPFLYNAASAQTACNNSPSLCNRAYNNITHLGAHDSPFLRDKSTSFSTSGNQYYDSPTQLDSGVRLLTAQVHKNGNSSTGASQWHLCHTNCGLLDMGTLSNWLGTIKTWMDNNPNDVVTILLVNSDNASPAELGSEFKTAGIDKYAYTPPSLSSVPKQWPTLQSLISNNTRLMTFVASLSTPSSDYPWLMDEFTFIFENDFNNQSPTDYQCTPARPTSLNNSTSSAASSGRMFLMNHFLYNTGLFGIQTPNSDYANITNAQTGVGSLGEQLTKCTAVYNKPPTFTIVDFTNMGPAMESVDKANGVSGATGRRTLPTVALNEKVSGGPQTRGSVLAVVVAVVVAVAFGS